MSLGAILLPLIKTKAKKYTSRILLVHLLLIINYFSYGKTADQVVCLTKGDAKEYKYTKK